HPAHRHEQRPAHGTGRPPPPPRPAARWPASGPAHHRYAHHYGPQPSPPRRKSTPAPPGSPPGHKHEDPGSPLIVQCSGHAIPPAITGALTSWQGHDLALGLTSAQLTPVLTCQRLSNHPGPSTTSPDDQPLLAGGGGGRWGRGGLVDGAA